MTSPGLASVVAAAVAATALALPVAAQPRQRPAEIERERATLEKQPPLPLARNRLIGRWRSESARPKDDVAHLAALLSGRGCASLFLGDGSIEFRQDGMALVDADGVTDLGAVSYREGANGTVFVLPSQGFRLLPFQFVTSDRITLVGFQGCTFVRRATGPAGPAAGRRGAPGPAPAAPAPRAAASRLLTLDDLMGYQCPDGAHLAVVRCFSDAADPNCGVLHLDQPPQNGFQASSNRTRGTLVTQVAACTPRRVVIDNKGIVVFAP